MNSEEYRLIIPEYLSGRLTPKELHAFEEAMKSNPELLIETEELRATWQSLAPLQDAEPSAALRTRFYERLASGTEQSRSRHSRLFGLWPVKPVWQVTFSVAIFAAGLLAGQLGRSSSTNQIAQLHGEVQRMRQIVALALLERQSASARLEGVSWSSRMRQPDREVSSALVSALNHDSNVNVRLSAVDALQDLGSDKRIRRQLIDSISAQQSPLVQIALLDALVQVHASEAGPELGAIARDGSYNSNVRQRAEWALQQLGLR